MESDQSINMEQRKQNTHIPLEVENLSILLDSKFTFPGTKFKFGIDPLLSLIPGVGDLLSFLVSGGLIVIIARHGVSRKVVVLMTINAFIDAVAGSIPVIGGIFDFFFKANERNVAILRKHYREGKYQGSGKDVILTFVITIFILLTLLIFLVWKLLEWIFSYIQSAG